MTAAETVKKPRNQAFFGSFRAKTTDRRCIKDTTTIGPSCGSGVFLVDSYKRMVQENLGKSFYCNDDAILKKLLTDNIYGIDINEEAIDVTIFLFI